MISSRKDWGGDKEKLNTVINSHPDKVWVDGVSVMDTTPYSGYVSQLKYRDTIKVTHKKKEYFFVKNTDGTYKVL